MNFTKIFQCNELCQIVQFNELFLIVQFIELYQIMQFNEHYQIIQFKEHFFCLFCLVCVNFLKTHILTVSHLNDTLRHSHTITSAITLFPYVAGTQLQNIRLRLQLGTRQLINSSFCARTFMLII